MSATYVGEFDMSLADDPDWNCPSCKWLNSPMRVRCRNPYCRKHVDELFPGEGNSVSQIFLDLDGVLGDFDVSAKVIFGLPPRNAEAEFGAKRFWADLQSHPGFYENLPLMPDAMELFEAVKHLNPAILTGLPQGDWAEPQKRAWGRKHFPDTKMICCASKDKRNHMQPGDVIVDDWPKYQPLWEEAGGIFVLHTSAKDSIAKLKKIGVL